MDEERMMKCPECEGMGGGIGGYDEPEWDDCPCCKGSGSVTSARLAEYRAEVKAVDDWCDKLARFHGWDSPDQQPNPPPFPGSVR